MSVDREFGRMPGLCGVSVDGEFVGLCGVSVDGEFGLIEPDEGESIVQYALSSLLVLCNNDSKTLCFIS